jgi:hypothetical protein
MSYIVILMIFQTIYSINHDFFTAVPTVVSSKGGFPFSAKCRVIDILRSLSFEIQTIKRNG